jgi:hypothetical protein
MSSAQSGSILAPRGGTDILGWRKSLSETAAFPGFVADPA